MALNIIGLITQQVVLEDVDYTGSVIVWHLKNLGLQILCFGLTFSAFYLSTRKRRLSLYSFFLIQVLIFHLIFFIDLEFEEGQYHFIASWPSWELSYLELNTQMLVDIIGTLNPMSGIFSDGIFMPDNLSRFYLISISSTLIYYFLVTWLTEKAMIRVANLQIMRSEREPQPSERFRH